MLLSFRVANHGSLREAQELNLVPAYHDDRPALPVTAIYGANASGKSTLLTAWEFFHQAVRRSQAQWLPGGPIPRRPFLLDQDSRHEPSSYAVDVLLDGVRYVYGFRVTTRTVAEEWLYAYPKRKRRVLFERREMVVHHGPTLTGERAAIRNILRPNSLYLSAAAQLAHTELGRLWKALTATEVVTDDVRRAFRYTDALDAAFFDSLGERHRPLVRSVLAAADLGIRELRRNPERTHPLVGDKADEVLEALRRSPEGSAPQDDPHVRRLLEGMTDSLEFVHRVGGEDFALPAEAESAGTRAWLALVAKALIALVEGGSLWIDEIEVSLHSLLTARLLRLFQSREMNPHGAQLVFTTHDAALLGTMLGAEVLRRDQVWFVEKDADTAASTLYPLSDFKPRKGENFERRYLAGSYGAVPLLSDTAFEDMIEALWGDRGQDIPA